MPLRRPTAATFFLSVVGLVSACSPPAPPDASVPDIVTSDASEAAVDVAPPQPDAMPRDAGSPPTPYTGPDDYCPGSAHCANDGDGHLYVGFATESINPTIIESEWVDANSNSLFESTESFTDTNGNGVFDATWIAGFSSARPARGQHDDLDARAVAFRYNGTTVALVVLDVVGYFRDEAERVRQHAELRGVDVDHVIVASTHVHEGVDTVGLWGRDPGTTGVDPTYQALTHQRAARAARRAIEAANQPANRALMRVAQVLAVDSMGDTRSFVSDTRDPTILDPTVTLVHFVRESAPTETIGSLVNWAAHPEYTGSRNNQLSADYVHELRRVTEVGDTQLAVAGLGGTTVFINGPLGGQVGPGDAAPIGRDGVPIREGGLEKAASAGRNVAALALNALVGRPVETGPMDVSYRTAKIYAAVENVLYHLAFRFGVVVRELGFFNRSAPPSRTNIPWVESRVTYLQVGPVATITAPGELVGELWVGTADNRWSFGRPRVNETVNTPDFSMAPAGPYLRDDMLANPNVRYTFVSGLSEDFLGYILAPWNYVLATTQPYVNEAEGDHYEETNSVGPRCAEHLQRPMVELARWRAPMR